MIQQLPIKAMATSKTWIRFALVKYATGGLTPDLTILLDLDVEVGLGRKKKITSEIGWMRILSNFIAKSSTGYLEMVNAEPKRWVVVNSEQAWEEYRVQAELRKVILARMKDEG